MIKKLVLFLILFLVNMSLWADMVMIVISGEKNLLGALESGAMDAFFESNDIVFNMIANESPFDKYTGELKWDQALCDISGGGDYILFMDVTNSRFGGEFITSPP